MATDRDSERLDHISLTIFCARKLDVSVVSPFEVYASYDIAA